MDGWFPDRTKGSHRQFKHHFKSGLLTLSGNLDDEVPRGTLDSIFEGLTSLVIYPRLESRDSIEIFELFQLVYRLTVVVTRPASALRGAPFPQRRAESLRRNRYGLAKSSYIDQHRTVMLGVQR